MKIQRDAWELPALFALIQQTGGIAADEMARVFNCGMGMLVVVPKEDLHAALDAVADAVEVGEIVPRQDAPVILT